LRVKVFYHDRCFDGASSAALFSRFYAERIRDDVEFVYSGLLHRAGALFNEADFDGDENAIVDFKYSSSRNITWWFDHHESAFLSPEDAEHFEQDESSRKFYDQDAKTAVEMKEPAMQLTMVIESTQDPEFLPRLIPLLANLPLAEVVTAPFVASLLPPLLERHRGSMNTLGERIESRDGTLFFDVTDQELEGYNKFVPYYLHPESVYSVGLSKSSFRVKVSVGSNPWAPSPPIVNLAKVCERYGGGGHARVGAISFDVTQHAAARRAAQEIVEELRSSFRAGRSE
jgi:hypothetical protein